MLRRLLLMRTCVMAAAAVVGDRYEASMTRLFVHGRTETVRPASAEAKAFVDAMGKNVFCFDVCLQKTTTPTAKLTPTQTPAASACCPAASLS